MIKLKDLLNEITQEDLKRVFRDVERFVERGSSFTLSSQEDAFISFMTREHGDVGSETPGREDYREAQRLKKELERKYPDAKITISTTDEFTNLKVDFEDAIDSLLQFIPQFAMNKEGKYKKGFEVFNDLKDAIDYIEKKYGRGFVTRDMKKEIEKGIERLRKTDYIDRTSVYLGSGKETRGTGYKDTKHIFMDIREY